MDEPITLINKTAPQPQADEPAALTGKSTQPTQATGATTQSSSMVMVVEDDKPTAALLEYLLARNGFKVMQAPDGREAQALITSLTAPPALVLLDLMLPYVDGYELLQLIRRQPGWQQTPVVILSAKSQETDIVRALKLGASDYVEKPFRVNELLARISRLTEVRT